MTPDQITQLVFTAAGAVGTAVTAVATIFLWRVTKALAIETKRMAEASAQPHIVATIEPNRWSMMHSDFRIENTGNAPAYDIQIAFEPPLPANEFRSGDVPLQRVSVLKPGQAMTTYLAEFREVLQHAYSVTTSWRRDPSKDIRETNIYQLDLRSMEGMGNLGASDPLIQIAEQLKKLREDWQQVSNGQRRVQVDSHTEFDRLHDQKHRARRVRQHRRRQSDQPQQPTKSDPAG